MIVDLPQPDRPTTAMCCPAWDCEVRVFQDYSVWSGRVAEMYLLEFDVAPEVVSNKPYRRASVRASLMEVLLVVGFGFQHRLLLTTVV